jgi:hypothetical protein
LVLREGREGVVVRGNNLEVQHFIYPLTAHGGDSFDGRDVTPHNFWTYEASLKAAEWGLSTYRLMTPRDWIWAYFGGPIKKICGVGIALSLGWNDEWKRHTVLIRWNRRLTEPLSRDPILTRRTINKSKAQLHERNRRRLMFFASDVRRTAATSKWLGPDGRASLERSEK